MATTEEENHVGFYEYMGLPRDDPEGFLAGAYALSAKEFLAGAFEFLGEDMVEEVLRSVDAQYEVYPTISSSPEEILASVFEDLSTADPELCGGSYLAHLYMLCACFHPHEASAPSTPPMSPVVVDVDAYHYPAPRDYDDGDLDLLGFTQDGEQDEATAAVAATVDEVDEVTVATTTMDEDDAVYEIVLNALGFDDFARGLREAIEAMMNREEALLRAQGSSVSSGVRPPV